MNSSAKKNEAKTAPLKSDKILNKLKKEIKDFNQDQDKKFKKA